MRLLQEQRYYSFVEPEGLEGLFRVTWQQWDHETFAIPTLPELNVQGEWIPWPDLLRHFVPGGLTDTAAYPDDERSERIVEVNAPRVARFGGGNPYHCPAGTGITSGRFTDARGTSCNPVTEQLNNESLLARERLLRQTLDGGEKMDADRRDRLEEELRRAKNEIKRRRDPNSPEGPRLPEDPGNPQLQFPEGHPEHPDSSPEISDDDYRNLVEQRASEIEREKIREARNGPLYHGTNSLEEIEEQGALEARNESSALVSEDAIFTSTSKAYAQRWAGVGGQVIELNPEELDLDLSLEPGMARYLADLELHEEYGRPAPDMDTYGLGGTVPVDEDTIVLTGGGVDAEDFVSTSIVSREDYLAGAALEFGSGPSRVADVAFGQIEASSVENPPQEWLDSLTAAHESVSSHPLVEKLFGIYPEPQLRMFQFPDDNPSKVMGATVFLPAGVSPTEAGFPEYEPFISVNAEAWTGKPEQKSPEFDFVIAEAREPWLQEAQPGAGLLSQRERPDEPPAGNPYRDVVDHSIEGIYRHELAHWFEHQAARGELLSTPLHERSEYQQLWQQARNERPIQNTVSTYAGTSREESVAEIFTVITAPDYDRAAWPSAYQELFDHVELHFNNLVDFLEESDGTV